MGLPIVVKATFMLTGMLGLKFFYGSQNQTAEAVIPINISQNEMEIHTTKIEINKTKEGTINSFKLENPRSTRASKMFVFPGTDIKSSYDFALNGKCGPGRCTSNETCVTWLKVNGKNNGGKIRESPIMFHECLKSQGDYYTKMDPSGVRLCPADQIHSISRESQKCLQNDPPCPLLWKFSCVNESDADGSIHSCKFKRCPSSAECVERVECDRDPPCFAKAVCV